MAWNPELYHKFQSERNAPFKDLYSMLRVRSGLEVVDLGCGPGELTLELAGSLPGSHVVGIDSSAEMLAKAGKLHADNLRFQLGRVEEISGSWDLVFSHATIHWVEDHQSLIPKLFSLVRPGGQLAVQLPANHRHPSQTCIHDVATEEPFRTALGGWLRHSPVLEIDQYARLLYESGAENILVQEKVYPHILQNAAAVADWTAGTTLVPYFEKLPADLHEPFMDRYREMLYKVWPDEPVFFTFRRILFAGDKPAR